LASQGLVLFLASSSGVGVASAGALSQRVAMTMTGLVIIPLSNVAMVQLSKLPEDDKRRYLVRMSSLTMGGLLGVAGIMSVLAHFIARFSHSVNAALLASLIPSYALWMVAQGTNSMLSRLSFARGAVRLYTAGTITGYALANLARWQVWHGWGFGPAIAAGSGIELLAALAVVVLLARQRSPVRQPLQPVAAK
jgi:hypothetical protein